MADLEKPEAPATKPDEVDLDAWLTGVVPTGKTFTIYQNGKLYDAYQDACDRYDDLVAGDSAQQPEADDGRVSRDTPLASKPEAASLRDEILNMEDQLRPGALTCEVRAANFDDQAGARRDAKRRDEDGAKNIDFDQYYVEIAARVIIHPRQPADWWRKVAIAVGARQWAVVTEALDASCEPSKGYNLDFSSRRSARR